MKHGSYYILMVGFSAEAYPSLAQHLGQHYGVIEVADQAAAEAELATNTIDLLLCYHSTTFDAIALLRRVRVDHPGVIRVIGGRLSEADAVTAINEAAIYQFFPEGWSAEQIELLVRRALENRELAYRHRHLSRELKFAENVLQQQIARLEVEDGRRFDKLLYVNPRMAELCGNARKAAQTELPVLIQGETGTGKDLLARAIHRYSRRHEQPLMVQNCGGLSDDLLLSELFGHKRGAFTGAVSDRLGLFPAADGGTVFLDEIAAVSERFQISLLRFLQNGEVKRLGSDESIRCNVRIIAASNTPLERLVERGEFRSDLYFRLNVLNLSIPPLRERLDEVPVLADYLARRYGEETGRRFVGLDEELIDLLQAYDWPGNVRELQNEVCRLVALTESGGLLTTRQVSPHLAALPRSSQRARALGRIEGNSLKEKVEFLERALVEAALQRHRWNQTRAAGELGLSRVGLANKIRRYGLTDNHKVA